MSVLQEHGSHCYPGKAATERRPDKAQASIRYRRHTRSRETKSNRRSSRCLSMFVLRSLLRLGPISPASKALLWLHELVCISADHTSSRSKDTCRAFSRNLWNSSELVGIPCLSKFARAVLS